MEVRPHCQEFKAIAHIHVTMMPSMAYKLISIVAVSYWINWYKLKVLSESDMFMWESIYCVYPLHPCILDNSHGLTK